MIKQKGFAHVLLILSLVILLLGAIVVVFWNKFNTPPLSTEKITSKEYASVTDSGLSFTYPSNWTILPPDSVSTLQGGDSKFASALLLSQKPNFDDGKIEVPYDHICINFTELAGNHPYSYPSPDDASPGEQFRIGNSTVAMLAEGDGNQKTYSGRLINVNPKGNHGVSYIALNNDYYLLATSQKNCYPSDNPKKRDLKTDTEEARRILKSVKLINS